MLANMAKKYIGSRMGGESLEQARAFEEVENLPKSNVVYTTNPRSNFNAPAMGMFGHIERSVEEEFESRKASAEYEHNKMIRRGGLGHQKGKLFTGIKK